MVTELYTVATEKNISLYKEWLTKVTGIDFTFDQAKKEFMAELEKGNEKNLTQRVTCIASKSSFAEAVYPNAIWQEILLDER